MVTTVNMKQLPQWLLKYPDFRKRYPPTPGLQIYFCNLKQSGLQRRINPSPYHRLVQTLTEKVLLVLRFKHGSYFLVSEGKDYYYEFAAYIKLCRMDRVLSQMAQVSYTI
ncbi:hypothetical protein RRG08_029595 [Elysia crispata]|uniref:Uncharacterized protein n=1 Tax=Elysia crispata TaxID=231223 RepID=A0AAE0XPL6_9GAST|nr:hypothetical protein RRG08_029595 [Elysia crispata]